MKLGVSSRCCPCVRERAFERLDDHEQRGVFAELLQANVVEIVAHVTPGRRANFFRTVPEAVRSSLLAALRAAHSQAAEVLRSRISAEIERALTE